MPMHKKAGHPAKKWLLYVLRCKDNSFYCGITNNLPGRIEEHLRNERCSNPSWKIERLSASFGWSDSPDRRKCGAAHPCSRHD